MRLRELRKIRDVKFFMLGIGIAFASSEYTSILSEAYQLPEVEYVKVELKIPVVEDHLSLSREVSPKKALANQKKNKTHTGASLGISNKGIAFIKSNEGYVPQAYWDVNGITVGWGHKINRDDPKWLQRFVVGQWLQRSYADYLFEKDVCEMVNPGLRNIFSELNSQGVNTKLLAKNQGFIDGLGDLIYNCGLCGTKETEFYACLKRGQIDKAIRLVEKTKISAKGHIERRKKTRKLMEG